MSTVSIRQLDDDTIRKIAAGEVVERPASVVKELVENSLDADASRIDVAVDAGGTERIRIADDGEGMGREDVQRAVKEHTTSKIADIDDLETGVATLGFRGEALHAISAVSRTTITTKPRGGDLATAVVVDHGELHSVEPAGRPEGTTVTVEELFRETPARREFLKAESTEFDHINRLVTHYALANPDVAFSLVHGDREVFSTPGRNDLDGAILSVYGREVAESMRPIDVTVTDPDSPVKSISGFVSHPETTRSTREYVSTFVNDRYVTTASLRTAIVDAYGGQLAPDRYPFAVIFLAVDPAGVDVNVHPRKLEVRFQAEAEVRQRVHDAVESALLEHGLIRTSAPRGRSAPEETPVDPANTTETPEGRTDASTSETEDTSGEVDIANSSREMTADESTHLDGADGESSAEPTGTRGDDVQPSSDTPSLGDHAGEPSSLHDPPWTAGVSSPTDPIDNARTGIHVPGTQHTLTDEPVEQRRPFDSLPAMRVLGQFGETYVVAEGEDGLLLIDQHAADERVNYEQLRAALDDPDTQALAEPVEVELTAREAAAFPAKEDALTDLGFRASLSDERTVVVHAVPAIFDAAVDPELLRDVLGEFLDDVGETSVDARLDAFLADLACYPSITGNTRLSQGSIRGLLEALDGCENPYACPHGRPVIVEIESAEIDDRFERDYPGHGARRD